MDVSSSQERPILYNRDSALAYADSLQAKNGEILKSVERLQAIVEQSLISIDHGFDSSKPGNSANGFIIQTEKAKYIATAAHNIENGNKHEGSVIDPNTSEHYPTQECSKYGSDTAITNNAYIGSRPGLSVGYAMRGDVVGIYGKKHTGEGKFEMNEPMWGVVLGGFTDQKGDFFYEVSFSSREPSKEAGDSGSPVVSLNSETRSAVAVGAFHGRMRDENGKTISYLFSPIPVDFDKV
ncbi:MAG: hypothetical protein ABIO02_05265 [Patescibacteria group bacterium]